MQFPSSLTERLPNQTRRYDDHDAATAQTSVILTGPAGAKLKTSDETTSVPDGWTKSTNPAEDRVYFRNSTLHLVTEAFVQFPWILERLMHWYQIISPFLESLEVEFELFLGIMDTRGESVGQCTYYLIDYTKHSVFWLRDVSTSSLGLPDIRGLIHFEHLLEEQFWIHVEYMPCPDLDLSSATKMLCATLATLAIDASTSAGSISPFTADECKSYSQELKQVLDTGNLADINWCTARIMSLLTQSRIVNLQGEPGARTDRSMVVNGQYPPPANYFFRLASSVLFGSPATYLRRWNGIWIDRVLYTREWRRIVKEMIEEWVFSAKIEVLIATGGVGLSAVTSSAPARALALISAAIALCNSAYSLVLAMQYRILGSHAADGAGFIQKHESSSTGLQSLALICSIPGALVIWTTVLSFLSVTLIILDMISIPNITSLLTSQHIVVFALLVGVYAHARSGRFIV